jgi:hypothetical protein
MCTSYDTPHLQIGQTNNIHTFIQRRATMPDIKDVIEAADLAFWKVVADNYPDAVSGDLSIDRTIALSEAQKEAVEEWVENNVPKDPKRSYRVINEVITNEVYYIEATSDSEAEEMIYEGKVRPSSEEVESQIVTRIERV